MNPIRAPWKGSMTARERFNRQMHYRSVDRCFNMEFGYWEENFVEWPMFRENGIRSNEEADRFFSFDPIHSISGNIFMHPAMKEEIISETDTHVTVRSSAGLIEERLKKGSSIPRYLGSVIRTPADWDRVKKEHFDVQHPDRVLDVASLAAKHPDSRDYPLGIHCGSMIGRVRDLLTFEGICYALYDYPDMLEDMVETMCVLVEHSLHQLLPHITFDFASGWEDICFNHGPILPPWFFRDVVAPRYRRIHEKLRQYGVDLWYTDCDGDVRPLIPIFLESGINCLFPFEVNSCTHPGNLLREYAGSLRIMGGVDKIELAKGPEAIDRYLNTLVPLVEAGGYIPFCDHRCPPNVKQEDYLYYLDKKEELFGMR
ncbi:MAG: uroporphyrinogen decarboxylase family protein [Christensenellales bacterium]|jgi:hypothetical protein